MQMPEFMQEWWLHDGGDDPIILLGHKPEHFTRTRGELDPCPGEHDALLSEVWDEMPLRYQQVFLRGMLITLPLSDTFTTVESGLIWWGDGSYLIEKNGFNRLGTILRRDCFKDRPEAPIKKLSDRITMKPVGKEIDDADA